MNQVSGTPVRIAVLAGGDSAEREVSLESGRSVHAALLQRGHLVAMYNPASTPLDQISKDTEVILPMLHGTGAEDGRLQQALDATGIPWIGSSAAASQLTFDKIRTQHVLRSAGLPVAPSIALNRQQLPATFLSASKSIGFPQVVKPAEQGSSVGVSIVRCESDLADAIQEVVKWGDRFLIEQFIPGRELTVPVIDGISFPAVEIIPSRSWYDYQAKYIDDATQYLVEPPNLPPELDQLVQRTCEVCGVSAISRTDLRIDNNGNPFILEINTIPGMTSHSLVPMSAQSWGISLGELCEQLILKALRRVTQTSWERSRKRHSIDRPV